MLSRPLRAIALVAIIGGFVIRALPLVLNPHWPFRTCDGRAYYQMGVNWATGSGLYLDDPALTELCRGISLGPSHHYAPLMALIEGSFVLALGETALSLVLPVVLLSVGAVVVAWWATRDLFGGDAALLVGAAISLEWTGAYYGTWSAYSENLVLITFTLTLWAILKALRDDRYLVLAGLFAGLGYLSKAIIGWLFLVAGAGGLLWRFWFRGWRILLNRWYWIAIGVFAIPVLLWALRNISLFWDGTLPGLLGAWQTSAPIARIVAYALSQPGLLLTGLVGKFPVLAVGLLLPFLPLLRGFVPQVRKFREEQTAGLWLTVALVFGIGWFFAASFWVTEQTGLLWADPIRYVMPAQVPLLWLLVQDRRPVRTGSWFVAFLIEAIITLRILGLVLGI